MVVQIGDLVAAAVPLELTTEVGFRIRDAMLRRSLEEGLGARATAVVGLANGYMQYVATREEYQAQHYEGGSTLYTRAAPLCTDQDSRSTCRANWWR
jgi:neutral ceramidase